MTPVHLRPSTLDEIIFEGRNKAYGAFDLRQSYPVHVRRAIGGAMLLFLLLAFAPIVVRMFAPPAPAYKAPLEPVIDLTPGPVFKSIEEPKPVVPPAAGSRVPTAALPTRIVADDQARPQEKPAVEPIDALPGPVTTIGPGEVPLDGLGVPGEGSANKPLDLTTPAASTDKPEVFLTAERMPKFVGGDAAMIDFLRRNMRYPAMALREQVEGKVFVAFTVSASGEIVDVQVIKGLGFGTDEEALRVVRKMPAWEPGAQNNHPVAVRYTLPITFRIGQ